MVDNQNRETEEKKVSRDSPEAASSAEEAHRSLLDDSGLSNPQARSSEVQANSPEEQNSGAAGKSRDAQDRVPELTEGSQSNSTNDARKNESEGKREFSNNKEKGKETDAELQKAIDKLEKEAYELEVAGMKSLLTEMSAAHEAHEKAVGKEIEWPEFYAKYMDDKVKAAGQTGVDTEALTKIFQDAGKAHHDFEVSTGETDEDWADWYARFVVDQIRSQRN